MSKRPGPYEKVDFNDIYDRIERIEEWIKALVTATLSAELKRKKDRRFWELLQSKSDKEVADKGAEVLTRGINEQVEEEFKKE